MESSPESQDVNAHLTEQLLAIGLSPSPLLPAVPKQLQAETSHTPALEQARSFSLVPDKSFCTILSCMWRPKSSFGCKVELSGSAGEKQQGSQCSQQRLHALTWILSPNSWGREGTARSLQANLQASPTFPWTTFTFPVCTGEVKNRMVSGWWWGSGCCSLHRRLCDHSCQHLCGDRGPFLDGHGSDTDSERDKDQLSSGGCGIPPQGT